MDLFWSDVGDWKSVWENSSKDKRLKLIRAVKKMVLNFIII